MKKKIGAELSRLEKDPQYFVQIQKWSHHEKTEYSYVFYAKTKQGKDFLIEATKETKEPGVLIDTLKVQINNFLQEYVIPNSQQITL